MTTVRTEFQKTGFAYRQILRQDSIAIYSQSYPEQPEPVAYEVVIIRPKANPFNGGAIQEYYPSTSEWGKYGWTYRTIEMAEAKFKDLLAKHAEMPDKV